MLTILLGLFVMLFSLWVGWQFMLLLARFFAEITEGGWLAGIVKAGYLGAFYLMSFISMATLLGMPFMIFSSYAYSPTESFFSALFAFFIVFALPLNFLHFVEAFLQLLRGRFGETVPAQVLREERSILSGMRHTLTPSFSASSSPAPSKKKKRSLGDERDATRHAHLADEPATEGAFVDTDTPSLYDLLESPATPPKRKKEG